MNIRKLLDKRLVILDGATGTELQRRGMPKGVCPEVWALQNRDVSHAIHKDYVSSGSDVIYACTFGANRLKLSQYGITDIRKINRDLAKLAKHAAKGKAIVAGDIGPLGKFIEPFGGLGFNEAVDIFKEQARGLLDGGVDILVIETMIDIQEARAALIACKELKDMFVMVSMTFENDGRTINGTGPVTALITLQGLGADAVGCNCSMGPKHMAGIIKNMKPYAAVPLLAKPNAGLPILKGGHAVFDMTAQRFASLGKALVKAGANMIGGCCGTTPAHIEGLKKKVKGQRRPRVEIEGISALSSARDHLILDRKKPLIVVGECINPSGKRALQKELSEQKMSLVRHLASEQKRNGAHLIDVNAGIPGIDESKVMREMISIMAVSVDVPLVIDSSDPKVIEDVLRLYPGRALINSISGEKKKMDRLLSVAKKYGSMFILLPISGTTVPLKLRDRKKAIKKVYLNALRRGFVKKDIIVDCMVLSLASYPSSAKVTMDTIQWCDQTNGFNTILGLSNISFGLPNRPSVNAAFLAMAVSKGLTCVIANPLNDEVMSIKRAADVLLEKDRNAESFISHFRNITVREDKLKGVNIPVETSITRCILEGNKDDVSGFVKEALEQGRPAEVLVSEVMIPAINQVGDLYEKKEYFLPQLIASAETMKCAFKIAEPQLEHKQSEQAKETVVLLATVKGDIHDIGKNIISLMLRNHGFQVIDLGKDVSSEKIIKEVKKHKSPIVGLSSLMTTTMINMKEVIDKAKDEGIDCRFIVGGAVVTELYARSIGAEYASDGVSAVRAVKRMSS